MNREPRQRHEGVIQAPMLIRAWLFLGLIVAGLSIGGFFFRPRQVRLAFYAPPLQSLLGTAVPPAHYLVLLIPYPLIVLGADELRKLLVRRYAGNRSAEHPVPDR